MIKKGILLINIGTPDRPDPKSVYCYLKQFLNDPRAIDSPGVIRWVLTNLIIVPFRYKKSAEAYQQIGTDAGSPSLTHSIQLKDTLARQLGVDYQVEPGMRYGNPNLSSIINKIKTCEQIILIYLFSHYSSAATGSAIEKLLGLISKQWNLPELYIKKDFYDHPGFIAAYTDVIKKALDKKNIHHIVFSYHGLPERHITKTACQAICWNADTCPSFVVDCLETLEEINIRARADWLALGGSEFIFVPCINDHPKWVNALADIIKKQVAASV